MYKLHKWTRIESSWTKTQLHWKDPDRVEQWNLSSGYTQGGILSVEKALGIWAALGSEHTAVQRYVWEMCFSKVHFWNVCFFKVYFSKVWRSSECKDQDRVEKWNGSRSESSCCHLDIVFKMINIMLEKINEENEKCMCLCKPCKSPDNVLKVLDTINDEVGQCVHIC